MAEIFEGKIYNEEINLILNNLNNEEKDFYIKHLIKLHSKKYLLYKTNFHGIYHSEKVMLFAYIIGLNLKKNGYPISEDDLKILLDAGAYHDIGRVSDREDSTHGLTSAYFYESKNVFKDEEIYHDKTNFAILKAITDYHSQNEIDNPNVIKNNAYMYDIDDKDYERYTLLANILKDADALDRKRFPDYDPAGLNTDYLRFKESVNLVNFASEINKIYRINSLIKPNTSLLTYEEGNCLHSIGYDFFKIPSILENGILCSAKLLEKNMSFMPNFQGGNGYYFISVVPTTMYHQSIKKDDDACQNFINKGITFLCKTQKLYRPLTNEEKDIAIEYSLPYDKSQYSDERFAYLEIKPEDITNIIILKSIGDMKLKDAKLLYNSFNVEAIKNKIHNFFSNISFKNNIPALNKLFDKYCNALKKYNNLSREKRIESSNKFIDILDSILKPINSIVINVLNNYYSNILNKDEPLIIDIVTYELQKNGYNFDYILGDNEYIFDVKKQKRLIKKP